jgi:uridine kinase
LKHIILISGKLQSGKNTFAEFLNKRFVEYGYKVGEDSFARSLKKAAENDFSRLCVYLNNFISSCKPLLYKLKEASGSDLVHVLSEKMDSLYTFPTNFYEDKNDITRILLQIYGTEIFRNRVDNDYWSKQVAKRCLENENDITIITDTRFENEIECVYDYSDEYDITTIRVERFMERDDEKNNHSSETGLDNYENWHYIVENNSNIDDFESSADIIFKEILK